MSRESFEKWLDDNYLFDTSEFIQDADERKKAKELNLVWKAYEAGIAEGRKQQWQPIETAPRNERVFVFSEIEDECFIGWNDAINGRWYFYPQGWFIDFHLSHWMPLPEAPK